MKHQISTTKKILFFAAFISCTLCSSNSYANSFWDNYKKVIKNYKLDLKRQINVATNYALVNCEPHIRVISPSPATFSPADEICPGAAFDNAHEGQFQGDNHVTVTEGCMLVFEVYDGSGELMPGEPYQLGPTTVSPPQGSLDASQFPIITYTPGPTGTFLIEIPIVGPSPCPGTNGAGVDAAIEVTVLNAPDMEILNNNATPNTDASNQSICSGDAIDLTLNVDPNFPASSPDEGYYFKLTTFNSTGGDVQSCNGGGFSSSLTLDDTYCHSDNVVGTLTNNADNTATVTLGFTPFLDQTGDHCGGMEQTRTFIVEPSARMSVITGTSAPNILEASNCMTYTGHECGTMADILLNFSSPTMASTGTVKYEVTSINSFGVTGVTTTPGGIFPITQPINDPGVMLTGTDCGSVQYVLTPFVDIDGDDVMDPEECPGTPISVQIAIFPGTDVNVAVSTFNGATADSPAADDGDPDWNAGTRTFDGITVCGHEPTNPSAANPGTTDDTNNCYNIFLVTESTGLASCTAGSAIEFQITGLTVNGSTVIDPLLTMTADNMTPTPTPAPVVGDEFSFNTNPNFVVCFENRTGAFATVRYELQTQLDLNAAGPDTSTDEVCPSDPFYVEFIVEPIPDVGIDVNITTPVHVADFNFNSVNTDRTDMGGAFSAAGNQIFMCSEEGLSLLVDNLDDFYHPVADFNSPFVSTPNTGSVKAMVTVTVPAGVTAAGPDALAIPPTIVTLPWQPDFGTINIDATYACGPIVFEIQPFIDTDGDDVIDAGECLGNFVSTEVFITEKTDVDDAATAASLQNISILNCPTPALNNNPPQNFTDNGGNRIIDNILLCGGDTRDDVSGTADDDFSMFSVDLIHEAIALPICLPNDAEIEFELVGVNISDNDGNAATTIRRNTTAAMVGVTEDNGYADATEFIAAQSPMPPAAPAPPTTILLADRTVNFTEYLYNNSCFAETITYTFQVQLDDFNAEDNSEICITETFDIVVALEPVPTLRTDVTVRNVSTNAVNEQFSVTTDDLSIIDGDYDVIICDLDRLEVSLLDLCVGGATPSDLHNGTILIQEVINNPNGLDIIITDVANGTTNTVSGTMNTTIRDYTNTPNAMIDNGEIHYQIDNGTVCDNIQITYTPFIDMNNDGDLNDMPNEDKCLGNDVVLDITVQPTPQFDLATTNTSAMPATTMAVVDNNDGTSDVISNIMLCGAETDNDIGTHNDDDMDGDDVDGDNLVDDRYVEFSINLESDIDPADLCPNTEVEFELDTILVTNLSGDTDDTLGVHVFRSLVQPTFLDPTTDVFPNNSGTGLGGGYPHSDTDTDMDGVNEVGGQEFADGDTFTEYLFNMTNDVIEVTYVFRPQIDDDGIVDDNSENCFGDSLSVVVTLEPIPALEIDVNVNNVEVIDSINTNDGYADVRNVINVCSGDDVIIDVHTAYFNYVDSLYTHGVINASADVFLVVEETNSNPTAITASNTMSASTFGYLGDNFANFYNLTSPGVEPNPVLNLGALVNSTTDCENITLNFSLFIDKDGDGWDGMTASGSNVNGIPILTLANPLYYFPDPCEGDNLLCPSGNPGIDCIGNRVELIIQVQPAPDLDIAALAFDVNTGDNMAEDDNGNPDIGDGVFVGLFPNHDFATDPDDRIITDITICGAEITPASNNTDLYNNDLYSEFSFLLDGLDINATSCSANQQVAEFELIGVTATYTTGPDAGMPAAFGTDIKRNTTQIPTSTTIIDNGHPIASNDTDPAMDGVFDDGYEVIDGASFTEYILNNSQYAITLSYTFRPQLDVQETDVNGLPLTVADQGNDENCMYLPFTVEVVVEPVPVLVIDADVNDTMNTTNDVAGIDTDDANPSGVSNVINICETETLGLVFNEGWYDYMNTTFNVGQIIPNTNSNSNGQLGVFEDIDASMAPGVTGYTVGGTTTSPLPTGTNILNPINAPGIARDFGTFNLAPGTASCQILKISYTPFIDENGNNTFDTGDCQGNEVVIEIHIQPRPSPDLTLTAMTASQNDASTPATAGVNTINGITICGAYVNNDQDGTAPGLGTADDMATKFSIDLTAPMGFDACNNQQVEFELESVTLNNVTTYGQINSTTLFRSTSPFATIGGTPDGGYANSTSDPDGDGINETGGQEFVPVNGTTNFTEYLYNTTDDILEVIYTFRPQIDDNINDDDSETCFGEPFDVVVRVSPIPTFEIDVDINGTAVNSIDTDDTLNGTNEITVCESANIALTLDGLIYPDNNTTNNPAIVGGQAYLEDINFDLDGDGNDITLGAGSGFFGNTRNLNIIQNPTNDCQAMMLTYKTFRDTDGDGMIDQSEDLDGDGNLDDVDEDVDGDGNLDVMEDVDGDGVLDTMNEDIDGDGNLDTANEDVDGDGNLDTMNEDVDGDGNLDTMNEDIDGDGNLDTMNEDVDGDGVLDTVNEDLDGDGNLDLGTEDIDGDTNFDTINEDTNNNGVLDPGEDMDGDGNLDLGTEDIDGDGNFDIMNEDLDGDGNLDVNEDLDSDGNLDVNEDLDGDGNLDVNEDLDGDGNLDVDEDLDNDGTLDVDEDIDNDGNLDVNEDVDGDGVLDTVNEDLDGDGRLDDGTEDVNNNGILDDTECIGNEVQILIYVEPTPLVTLSATPTDMEICSSEQFCISVRQETCQRNGTAFMWTSNGAAFGSQFGTQFIPTNNTMGVTTTFCEDLTNPTALPVIVTYTVTPYSFGPNGLDDNASGDDCVGVAETIQVLVKPRPNQPTLTAESEDICLGDQLVIESQIFEGDIVEYHWFVLSTPTGDLTDGNILTDIIGTNTTLSDPANTANPDYYNTNQIDADPQEPGQYVYCLFMVVDGCVSMVSHIDIIVYDDLNVNVTPTDASDCSTPDGRLTIDGLTAGEAYTVTYNYNGGSTQTLTNLMANGIGEIVITGLTFGSYDNIIVTNDVGCQSASMDVSINAANATAIAPTNNGPVCEGEDIQLFVGMPSATMYEWRDGAGNLVSTSQSPIISNLTAGTYTYSIEVTFANGCTTSANTTVVVNGFLGTPTATVTDAENCGANDGIITISGLTGTSDYIISYAHNGGGLQTFVASHLGGSIAITDLAPGMYTMLSLEDQNGCIATINGTFTIAEPDSPTVTAASNSPVCLDGSADLMLQSNPSGTASTYTYSWSGPNGFTSTAQNPTLTAASLSAAVNAGTYTVVVTDANDCTAMATVDVSLLDRPNLPTLAASSTEVCSGEDVTITSDIYTGGNVSYNWSTDSGTTFNPSNSNEITFAPTATTDVLLYVTVDNCLSDTAMITINVNQFLGTLQEPFNATDLSVCGGTDGSISFSTLTGAGTYTVNYAYNSGALQTFTDVATAGAVTLTGLDAGTYSNIIITDENGCSVVVNGNIDIDEPNSPTVVAFSNSPICLDGNTDLLLIADTSDTFASSTYSFDWTGPSGFNMSTTQDTLVVDPTTLNAVANSGIYTVVVTDNTSGCSDAADIEVFLTERPAPAVLIAPTEVCVGDQVVVTAVMAADPATVYYWDTEGDNTFIATTEDNISYLATDTTTVLFYSSVNSCVSDTVALTINANMFFGAPSDPLATITPSTCGNDDGSIIIDNLTDSGAYTINWTYEGLDQTFSGTPTNDTIILSGLTAGVYENFTIVDQTGCTFTFNADVLLDNPAGPIVDLSSNSPICLDGNTDLILYADTTGTLDSSMMLVFEWTGPDNFNMTTANDTLIIAAADLNPLTSGGTYTVEVIDTNSCATISETDVVFVDRPSQPTLTASSTEVCVGSEVTVTSNSYTGAMVEYQWSVDSGMTFIPLNTNEVSFTANDTSTVMLVVQVDTCLSDTALIVINTLMFADTAAISSTNNPTTCGGSDGQIAIGGLTTANTYDLQYNYNGGSTLFLNNLIADGDSIIIPNLTAGNYANIILSDANACMSSPALEADLLDASFAANGNLLLTSSAPSLCGGMDGSIRIDTLVEGMTYEVSYTYNNGPLQTTTGLIATADSSIVLSNLAPGDYANFIITDENGCEINSGLSTTIEDATFAANGGFTIANTAPTMCGGTDGTITLDTLVEGVIYTVSYTYNGGPLQSTSGLIAAADSSIVLSGLAAGDYANIIITDENNCEINTGLSTTLEDGTFASNGGFAIASTPPSNCGGANGVITIDTLVAGIMYTVSYTYNGGPLQTSPSLFANSNGTLTLGGLTAGDYANIILTDQNGCMLNTGLMITVEDAAFAATGGFAINSTPPTGCGSSNGTITIDTLSPGIMYIINYTFNGGSIQTISGFFADADGSLTINGLTAGNYANFILTDQTGCQVNTGLAINITDASFSGGGFAISNTAPTTCGGTDGTITIDTLTAGMMYNVSYTLDNGPAQNVSGLFADANGRLLITNLAPGDYANFILTDENNCEANTGLMTTITDATFAANGTLSISGTNPQTCEGSDGFISIDGLSSGVSYDVSYTVDNGPAQLVQNIFADANGIITIANLGAGDYDNFMLTDENDCDTNPNLQVTLEENTFAGFAPFVSAENAPSSCGGNDGSIIINRLTSGVTYDVSYTYNGGSTQTITGLVATGPFGPNQGQLTLSNLAAGNYDNIILTDENGCTANVGSGVISDPTFNGTASISIASTDVTTCSGSDGEIVISGLNINETYDLSYSYNGTQISAPALVADVTGSIRLMNLAAGTYSSFNFTDSNGCTASQNTTITINEPSFAASGMLTINNTAPTTCDGNDGTIIIDSLVAGVIYTVNYTMDGGPIQTISGLVANTDNQLIINGLSAGTYENFVFTDENNCVSDNNISQLTYTETYSGPTIGYDGDQSSGPAPSVALVFPGGFNIINTEATVVWEKVDAGTSGNEADRCGATDLGGGVFWPEAGLSLISPDGTNVELFSTEFYGGGDYAGVLTNTYIDGEMAQMGGTSPIAGTFSPTQALATINGETANGTWSLIAVDNFDQDPMCVQGFSVNVTAQGPLATIIEDNSAPDTPEVVSPFNICEGESINFDVITPFDINATYAWTGPNGFTASDYEPVILEANPTHNGIYTLVVSLNNCEAEPATVEVTVNALPTRPVISVNSPICEDQNIELSTTNTCATYQWISPNGPSNNPILSTTTPSTSIPAGDPDYTAGIWSLICVSDAGCTSEASEGVEVVINAIPVLPEPSNSGDICEGEDITLFPGTNNPIDATYTWYNCHPDSICSTGPDVTQDATYGGPTIGYDGNQASGPEPSVNLAFPDGYTVIGVEVSVTWEKVDPNTGSGNDEKGLCGAVDQGNGVFWPEAGLSLVSPNGTTIALFPTGFYGGNTYAGVLNNTYSDNAAMLQTAGGMPSSGTFAPVQALSDLNGELANGTWILRAVDDFLEDPMCVQDFSVSVTAAAPSGPAMVISTEYSPTVTGLTAGSYEYFVEVSMDGCTSGVAGTTFNVFAAPNALPTNNGGNCGESLELFANPTPADEGDYTYAWTGPNSFSSSEANPVIDNVTNDMIGTYTVIITSAQGCESEPSFTQVSTVSLITQPTISVTQASICEGEEIELLTNEFDGDNIMYTWTIDGDDSATFTSNDPFLTIDTAHPLVGLEPGSYNAVVSVEVDGCLSDQSEFVSFLINPRPNTPSITSAMEWCEGETITFETDLVIGVNYTWTGPNGFNANVHNPTIENASTTDAGVYIVVSENNGCVSEVDSIEIFVNEIPDNVQVALDPDGVICEGEDVELFVTNPDQNTTYTWFSEETGEIVGTGTLITLENVSVSDNGSYYVVPMNSNNCSFDPTLGNGNGMLLVEVTTSANFEAFAGADAVICSDIYALFADPLPQGANAAGAWSSPSVQVSFSSTTNNQVDVSNLQDGNNMIIWTVTGVCGASSADTLMITRVVEPVAVSDSLFIPFNTSIDNINLMANDIIVEPYHYLFDFTQAQNGTVRLGDDGTFSYEPEAAFSGMDEFTYTICTNLDASCEGTDFCSEARVVIVIEADTECSAPSVFTPNNDGLNDTFIIPCLGNYPNSTLAIYNRWGDEVFRSDNYQNDWEGRFNGEDLPTGTYFYILNVNDPEGTNIQGYVYIQRE